MRLKICLLPGDGVGPEVTSEAVKALQAFNDVGGYSIEFRSGLVGGAAIRETGHPLPPATLDTCLESDAVLLGAVGSPEFESSPPSKRPEAGLLQLRTALGGFANLRPARAWDALLENSPFRAEVVRGVDILIVRELLGGLYFSEPRGFEQESRSAFNSMRYSEREIERVARVAFVQALKRRRKVTSVDKANVLETSRLWRDVVTRVGREYPQVTLEHMYVDACAMFLSTNPRRFDVILTENLFGDILSDQAAAFGGSMGLLPSATVGGAVDLYEPVHGSAPDIAGKGRANPIGAIASAAMLLRHSTNLDLQADYIDAAIDQVLKAGHRTADLLRVNQAPISTAEMGRLIYEQLCDTLHIQHAYHAV